MEKNKVTWSVYVGDGSTNGPVSVRKLGEFDSKSKAHAAVMGARGGKYAPILKDGHTYFVNPKR